MLHHFIETIVPSISAACELIGIFIVVITVISAFYNYMKSLIRRTPSNAKFQLANGLATSLSFKMAAELLKTVIVSDISELILLGAIIILRAMMAVMLHFEMKHSRPLEVATEEQHMVDEMAAAAVEELAAVVKRSEATTPSQDNTMAKAGAIQLELSR